MCVFPGSLFISITIIAESWIIAYIEGETSIHRGNMQEIVDFGSQLQPGDTVSIGTAALAILESSRENKIKLKKNTQLRLDSLEENVKVHLQRGGVFSLIARLFRNSCTVTTPSVAAGVRGTEFFIACGLVIEKAADIWLCANEGSMAVKSAQQEVLVQAGEGVNIIIGTRITEPRFYPWTRELNWNSDPDAGNVRDTTDLIALCYDLLDIDYDWTIFTPSQACCADPVYPDGSSGYFQAHPVAPHRRVRLSVQNQPGQGLCSLGTCCRSQRTYQRRGSSGTAP